MVGPVIGSGTGRGGEVSKGKATRPDPRVDVFLVPSPWESQVVLTSDDTPHPSPVSLIRKSVPEDTGRHTRSPGRPLRVPRAAVSVPIRRSLVVGLKPTDVGGRDSRQGAVSL